MRHFTRRPTSQKRRPWYEIQGLETACVAAWQPQHAPNEQEACIALDTTAAAINWALPAGYRPTWTPLRGWGFGEVRSWPTAITPAVNGWSMICKFTGGVVGNYPLCGFHVSTTCRMNLYPCYTGSVRYYRNGGSYNASPGVTSGVMAVCNQKAYLNGLFDGNLTGSQSGAPVALRIGSCQGTLGYWQGQIQAWALYKEPLSAANVWQLTERMNRLECEQYNYWQVQRKWYVPFVTPPRSQAVMVG